MLKKSVLFSSLFIFLSFSLLSCGLLFNDPPIKIYPESLTLKDYGVLKYERTVLDDTPLFCAVKSGTDIVALSETSVFVIDALENNIKRRVNLQFSDRESIFHHVNLIVQFGKYVVVSRISEKDTGSYRLTIIDSGTLETQKINLSQSLFEKFNENIDYISYIVESKRNTIVMKASGSATANSLYYETSNFIEWEKIDKDGFGEKPGMNADWVIDNGITYSIGDRSSGYSDTYLCASRDECLSWSESSLGTNYGRTIIVDGDTVWVACFGYHKQVFIISSNMIGGGLHKLQWSYQ